MNQWVVVDYKPKGEPAPAPLTADERAQALAVLRGLAAEPISTHDLVVGLKGAFPELAERVDGERVESLCRQLVSRGELKEV
ncbi:MAG: lantibiotic dehydratase family protein [Bacteroidetes bacterium]|nr:lantibiotic dehydratase family protein [Bacteroidota bacterium]